MTVESLAAARFGRDSDPASHKPRAALIEMLRALDAGEIEADHLIIAHGQMGADGSCTPGMMQAGSFDSFAQLGLLYRVMRLWR